MTMIMLLVGIARCHFDCPTYAYITLERSSVGFPRASTACTNAAKLPDS